jgi:hypothetical protein
MGLDVIREPYVPSSYANGWYKTGRLTIIGQRFTEDTPGFRSPEKWLA